MSRLYWPEVKHTVNRCCVATTPLVALPQSFFLMLPSRKFKLLSTLFIVYTVICCVNISVCYIGNMPFWKTLCQDVSLIFSEWNKNRGLLAKMGQNITTGCATFVIHHCIVYLIDNDDNGALPLMCAFTLKVFGYIFTVYIYILYRVFAFMMFVALLALLDVTVSSTYLGVFFLSRLCNGWLWCMCMLSSIVPLDQIFISMPSCRIFACMRNRFDIEIDKPCTVYTCPIVFRIPNTHV